MKRIIVTVLTGLASPWLLAARSRMGTAFLGFLGLSIATLCGTAAAAIAIHDHLLDRPLGPLSTNIPLIAGVVLVSAYALHVASAAWERLMDRHYQQASPHPWAIGHFAPWRFSVALLALPIIILERFHSMFPHTPQYPSGATPAMNLGFAFLLASLAAYLIIAIAARFNAGNLPLPPSGSATVASGLSPRA